MIPKTESKLKTEIRAGHAQINVKVPVQVRAQFQREADRRCEDLATTVRRHLYQSLGHDQVTARLEALERKVDTLLEGAADDRLQDIEAQIAAFANAALDMERKLNESVSAAARVETKIQKLVDVYNMMADVLNGRKG